MKLSVYEVYKGIQLLSRILPRRFAYWIALRIAYVYYLCDRRGRTAIMSNFKTILQHQGVAPSEQTLHDMARQNFRYFSKHIVDFFKFSHCSVAEVQRLVSMEHVDYFQQAAALGHGVIAITAHLGNWEVGGAVMSALGYKLHAVYLPERVGKIDSLFEKYRTRRGMQVIPLGQAARGVLQALRRNEMVAMLADRDYTAHNEPIPFFGKPACLSSGPARIALKTGAPIVPAFLLRQPDDTFLYRVHPPIVPNGSSSLASIQEAIRNVIEAEISAHPLQWFMFEDFWSMKKP